MKHSTCSIQLSYDPHKVPQTSVCVLDVRRATGTRTRNLAC